MTRGLIRPPQRYLVFVNVRSDFKRSGAIAQDCEATGWSRYGRCWTRRFKENRENCTSKTPGQRNYFPHLLPQRSSLLMMHRSARALAVVIILWCAGIVFSTFHQDPIRRSRLLNTPVLPEQQNFSVIPDPWTYSIPPPAFSQSESLIFVDGLRGKYRLSYYTQPTVQMLYMTAFMFGCLGDLFDAIANQNHHAHEPYPQGHYVCNREYEFHHGPTTFQLYLVKVDAPRWEFTFADIGDDLTAIFNAVQYLDHAPYGIPQTHIDVYRYRNGQGGPTFLASRGGFTFGVASTNVSVT